MSKFKVGDKVRILDGSKIKDYTGGWCDSLKLYTGHNSTVIDVMDFADGRVGYKLYGTGKLVFDERSLKHSEHENIVFYRKGNEVIALDKRTGKKAIAKCSTEDTFDFNIGAKLAFERLMNGNKESITVEDMRKKLDFYCFGRSCCGCKLESPTYRCGRGAHFMTKDDAGNYKMSNKEIKDAFNIVFGTVVKEVKRRAKKGDYVKIVKEFEKYCDFSKGDILQIIDNKDGLARYGYDRYDFLFDDEYIVLEGYKPDKNSEQKEPHKFKVGDIVKGNSESDGRYNFTNSNMTRGKVTSVTCDTITIEVLEHKTSNGKVGEKYDVDPKYFDLMKENPKLYNGKIVFTKGDDIFKTGHIYEVKDGRINTAGLFVRVPMGEPFKNIEDVKDYFAGNFDGKRNRKIGWTSYTLELMEVKED